MRRIKTEVAIIGSGATAMLAANRLTSQGTSVVLVNPEPEFGIGDLRPSTGLGLWNAAYRAEQNVSLADLYETLIDRMREVFPATVEQSGLTKGEYLSILSSTLIHRTVTEELEREFFKLERKPWSSGQFRLVNPEHVLARTKRLGVELPHVAQVEGGVVRAYGLWWDAAKMGLYLSQFIHNKFLSNPAEVHCFKDADIKGRYGRKIVLLTRDGEEINIESERAVYVFLTGELLPHIRSIVAACDEPWIQGVRKRRKEQHFVWFERPAPLQARSLASAPSDDDVWLELGQTRYRWSMSGGSATWRSGKGPDGLERVVDEGLRLHGLPRRATRFTRAERAFKLEWDWKNPQWRETSHKTFWATSFEGDLVKILELLWNLPHH